MDFILSLISIGHFAYACYRQPNCGSSAYADAWRCYNAFGYRLHNYVLPGVVSVLIESIIHVANTYKANKKNDEENISYSKSWRTVKWVLLGSTITMNIIVMLVFVPFFVSNTVPMLIAYCWFLLPILGGLVLVYAIFITSTINALRKCKNCGFCFCLKFFGIHCLVGLQVFGCLILGMAFNYSQYNYFGADYLPTIGFEAQSRDTVTWYNTLTNSTQLIIDNALTVL